MSKRNEKKGQSNRNSEPSRRKFLRSGLAAATGAFMIPSATAWAAEPFQESNPATPLACIDYGKSFFCNTAEFNSVRMWIESRTTIIDTQSGTSTIYYQGASCKSENTFGQSDLFYKDNYDFLPIFGDGKVLVFRRHISKRGEAYQSIKKMEEMWGGKPVIYTPAAKTVTELDTFEKIRDTTAAGIPIVTQTEFENKQTGLRAIIEAPCKTMNISHPTKIYQVDTGPIAFPDLSKKFDVQIKCLSLAFIAFNAPHFADFVIEAPSPVMVDGKEVATVYHYSKMETVQVKNRIFGLGKI
ncbi:MAG: hypothetical protein ABIN89_07000 [Chitinophagaceae bacterium]